MIDDFREIQRIPLRRPIKASPTDSVVVTVSDTYGEVGKYTVYCPQAISADTAVIFAGSINGRFGIGCMLINKVAP